MIRGQQKGEGKADKGKGYEDCGVKVSLGDPLGNSQGQNKDIDRTDTVQHGQTEKNLRYASLLLPE
jgi:hypothetical protein